MRALFRDTLRSFTRHGGTLLGGALAFFALLSALPTFVIALDITGRVTSESAARAELLRGLRSWMGRDGARTAAMLLDNTHFSGTGLLERVIGGLVLIYGSTRLFSQTQRALNHMWDVTARPPSDLRGRLLRVLEKRVLAFAMVLVCALFLLASTLLRAMADHASDMVGTTLPHHWHTFDHFLTFGVSTLLFTAVFKWLPDVKIAWRDAAAGAFFTALLFAVGKLLIARYLAHKSNGTVFGVAGSVVMVMLWVHYTAQIFFLGAAFTAVRAQRVGRPLLPTEDALRISVEGEL